MRLQRFHALAAWAIMLVASGPAPGQTSLVTIQWEGSGRFERRVAVGPGKFMELCGKLDAGTAVDWRFQASERVDFNIHYHEGDRVRTPAQANQRRSSAGVLHVASSRDYCWMWTNKTSAPVDVAVTLSRVVSRAGR